MDGGGCFTLNRNALNSIWNRNISPVSLPRAMAGATAHRLELPPTLDKRTSVRANAFENRTANTSRSPQHSTSCIDDSVLDCQVDGEKHDRLTVYYTRLLYGCSQRAGLCTASLGSLVAELLTSGGGGGDAAARSTQAAVAERSRLAAVGPARSTLGLVAEAVGASSVAVGRQGRRSSAGVMEGSGGGGGDAAIRTDQTWS